MNVLSCGLLWAKSIKHFNSVITDIISLSRHTQKSSQHVRACATGDGAICSKNRKIVPYHGDSPNSRISARLRSPSPIMAPGFTPDWMKVLLLIGWKSGASFLSQSRCVVNAKPITFRHSNENRSIDKLESRHNIVKVVWTSSRNRLMDPQPFWQCYDEIHDHLPPCCLQDKRIKNWSKFVKYSPCFFLFVCDSVVQWTRLLRPPTGKKLTG